MAAAAAEVMVAEVVVVVAEVAVALVVMVAAVAATAAFLRRHSVVRDIFVGATVQMGLGPGEVGSKVVVLPRTIALPVVSLVSGKQCSSPSVGAGVGG